MKLIEITKTVTGSYLLMFEDNTTIAVSNIYGLDDLFMSNKVKSTSTYSELAIGI